MLWFGLIAIGVLALGLIVLMRRSERESVLAARDEIAALQETVDALETRIRALEAIAADAPLRASLGEPEAPSPASAQPRRRTNA